MHQLGNTSITHQLFHALIRPHINYPPASILLNHGGEDLHIHA